MSKKSKRRKEQSHSGRAFTLRRIPGRIEARYDVAQTTTDNARHWANADSFSADSANSFSVRRTLRNRSRYEVANNSYAKGIVTTLANDTIGIGPFLQVEPEQLDDAAARALEAVFEAWSNEIGLARKLWTMRHAMAVDGEAFAILVSNPRLSLVKLDIMLIEADRVTTPDLAYGAKNAVDGIVFDNLGIPVMYHVLDVHPGDISQATTQNYKRIPAGQMIHLFSVERPGQHRGIPETTPSLLLFAQMRRYTEAVVAAAETAADFAAVLESEYPPNSDGDIQAGEPFDTIELEKRMATVLPAGAKLNQIRAEQPSTIYSDFKHEIIGEVARPWGMPRNIALADSSRHNYASGRLDHLTYDMHLAVIRASIEFGCLDKLFAQWIVEAVLIEGLLPQRFREVNPLTGASAVPPHRWSWRSRDHVDPQKVAIAQQVALTYAGTTLADIYGAQRKDWETQLRQRYAEIALERQLKAALPPEPSQPASATTEKKSDAVPE